MNYQLLALAGLLFSAVAIAIHWKMTYAKLPGRAGLPIIGHTHEAIANMNSILDWCLTEMRAVGLTFNFKVIGQPHMILTCDPRNVEHILSKNFKNYGKGPEWYRRFKVLLGDGIFNVDGKTWLLHRKLSSRMFSTASFRDNMHGVFCEHAEKVNVKLGVAAASGEVVDLQDILLRFTLDSIAKIAFGQDVGSLERRDVPFATAFDFCQLVTNDRFFLPGWEITELFSANGRKLRKNIKILNDYTYELLRARRAQGETKVEAKYADLLSFFIGRNDDETGKPFTDEFLRDIVMNFIIAGRDTTAQALTWIVYNLIEHPEVERKLLAEINELFGENGEVNFSGIKDMKYCQAVMSESLRLYPSVPKDAKWAYADDVLPDGTPVKKGMFVAFLPHTMGRCTQLWGDDAETFNPERWLGPDVPKQPDYFKFTAFQAGKRRCLGMDMAYLEAKTILAIMLPKYKFSIAPGTTVEANQRNVTLPVLNGLRVVVTQRT